MVMSASESIVEYILDALGVVAIDILTGSAFKFVTQDVDMDLL